MKFTKFGKALLMSALSAGVILCVTSCVRSYTVGYLYVTGTVTAESNGSGIISGYKIDHNTGFLTPINGLPISSGGANPERAVLIVGSKFFYVLNAGVNAQGGATCTTANPCQNSNITEFAVGGNGIMTPQETFYTQGINPFRMIADTSGNYLLVLDHDSPNNATCKLALGPSATTCGDITVFQINQTTGRLTLVVNAQVTGSSGTGLTYFPVPANPIDFVLHIGLHFYGERPAAAGGDRRLGVPVCVLIRERAVVAGPEQLAAAGRHAGDGDCERIGRDLRAGQRAGDVHADRRHRPGDFAEPDYSVHGGQQRGAAGADGRRNPGCHHGGEPDLPDRGFQDRAITSSTWPTREATFWA